MNYDYPRGVIFLFPVDLGDRMYDISKAEQFNDAITLVVYSFIGCVLLSA